MGCQSRSCSATNIQTVWFKLLFEHVVFNQVKLFGAFKTDRFWSTSRTPNGTRGHGAAWCRQIGWANASCFSTGVVTRGGSAAMRAKVGNGAPNTESTWWDWKPAVYGWGFCERLFHSQWYRNKHLIPLQVSHVDMFGYVYLGRTPMKDEHIFIVSTFYAFQMLKWCLPYKHMLFPIEPCFFWELVSL